MAPCVISCPTLIDTPDKDGATAAASVAALTVTLTDFATDPAARATPDSAVVSIDVRLSAATAV